MTHKRNDFRNALILFMLVGAAETPAFAGSGGSSCEAHHRGRLLSKIVLEGNEVTPGEAQAKWDSWAATQAALYLSDDFEPDLRGARSYDKYRGAEANRSPIPT
jgi:hypothetical protein